MRGAAQGSENDVIIDCCLPWKGFERGAGLSASNAACETAIRQRAAVEPASKAALEDCSLPVVCAG